MSADKKANVLECIRSYVERARAFSGWRFDDIEPKPLGPALPWNYGSLAAGLLEVASSVLDMGTGGGEVFAELCSGYKGRAVAAEEWKVNVHVAARRLRGQGIPIVYCRSSVLPFQDDVFELVLNRHMRCLNRRKSPASLRRKGISSPSRLAGISGGS